MKRKLFITAMLVFALTLACAIIPSSAPTAPAPNVETIVAATVQAMTVSAPPTAAISPTAQANGTTVSFGNVGFFLPADVASSALAGNMPAIPASDGPGWDAIPAHVKFQLQSYPLYGTFHEPHLLVIPAQEYAAVNEGASRSIARLQAILNGSAAPTAGNLPSVASFNAGQLFAAQIQVVHFANGSGVRFLTEYGQYYATANNHDLFYQFQGLTNDGKYYLLAILPVSHPLLAFDEKPETVPPAGGIPFPGYDAPDAVAAYYDNIVILLDQQAASSFTPALVNLDALIQSLTIQ